MEKKRYCLVGVSSRGQSMFAKSLLNEYSDVADLVGFCDINRTRMETACRWLKRDIPCYTDFDKMIAEQNPDVIIVTTKDSVHHQYIIRALEYDKDVITEKPMTIDEVKCKAILEAEKKSKGKLVVTFNYRYAPYITKVKELLKEGIVGDIYSVEFNWYLDTVHGASYYHRWNAQMANSGGLLVHKATHHFDMVNWWLDQEPEEVFAFGSRKFYGDNRYTPSERCLVCSKASECEFYLDIKGQTGTKEYYLDAEFEDGYIRDRCVFSPTIDIYDTMTVAVKYEKGVQMAYTLSSYVPFEGWQVAINGSKGRLEAGQLDSFLPEENRNFAERTELRRKSIDRFKAAKGDITPLTSDDISFYPLFGGVQTYTIERASGGHGGGDVRLKDMLFRENIPDPLGHSAGSRAGAMSILTGVAANKSIVTKKMVNVKDLLK